MLSFASCATASNPILALFPLPYILILPSQSLITATA